jgi:hydroxymethylpyrimidine/phosphomethylpyrimidine kinase
MPVVERIPVCLSIAGSDSGGGAGIQADIKSFARCGVHGTTAITAITAQNTVGVTAIEPVSPEVILAQIRSVLSDLGIDAVKIGMLGDEQTIVTVAAALDELQPGTPIVVDPVMVSESGASLLAAGAEDALRALLLPRATVITPNLPEARVLAGIGDHADGDELARAVHRLGTGAVLLTGGHRGKATDLLFDGSETIAIPGERHPDGAGHGSGCTHSSALAANLALGRDLVSAAWAARMIAGAAVRDGLRDLGAGAGPVNALGIGGSARFSHQEVRESAEGT